MTITTRKINIIEFGFKNLADWLLSQNIESYRAEQIFKWIYLRQADSFNQMTDLNKEMRAFLSQHYSIRRLRKIRVEKSRDGSSKYLFRLKDGQYIESVLIPERDHYTLCISSQVGCAQGCRFCLTGKDGFIRNLTKSEIISQVRDISGDILDSARLTNIVLMGMGEPLANYKNVLSAIQTLTDNKTGLNFSSRRITLSTAGLIPNLKHLGRDTRVNLAISLNATDNPTRDILMPINRRYPIEKLLDACSQYPLQSGRRITFEYVLLKDINDKQEDAKRLARLLRPLRAKINLIPFNDYEGSEFVRPGEAIVHQFQEMLLRKNYTVIIRDSRGQDISAACGQLRAKTNSQCRKSKK
jgi:23S rRNA (adenine2503-C2)-methyltransferase